MAGTLTKALVRLPERDAREFAPESVGKLTRPVDIPAWEKRVRGRFGFLAQLDDLEQRWAACDPRAPR